MTTNVSFEICPNCREHGRIMIGNYRLPDVTCQEHGQSQVTALKANGLITDEEQEALLRALQSSGLFSTWTEVIQDIVVEVIGERGLVLNI